jgi:tetratricopeptide (TPR) repeat protein
VTQDRNSATIHSEVWQVVELLERLPATPTTGHRLDELSIAFDALSPNDEAARRDAETKIWAIWADHVDPQAKLEMKRAMDLFSAGQLSTAITEFDSLIEHYPVWAEAWNKRATVHFLMGNDSASVRDIYQTLLLEPRHFGALSGFAQICMRNNAQDAAQAALRHVLHVYPSAIGVANAVADFADGPPNTLH